MNAQEAQDRPDHGIRARVYRNSERLVSVDSIQAKLVLQFVGLSLLEQSGTASFLFQIDDRSGALVVNKTTSQLDLGSTVAIQRTKRFTIHASRVNPNEGGPNFVKVSPDQRC